MRGGGFIKYSILNIVISNKSYEILSKYIYIYTHTHNHTYIYSYDILGFKSALGIMVIISRNGIGDLSSNFGQRLLHFTLC